MPDVFHRQHRQVAADFIFGIERGCQFTGGIEMAEYNIFLRCMRRIVAGPALVLSTHKSRPEDIDR